MRWEVRFYRQGKLGVDLRICHPSSWAKAWLGSCQFLQDKFKKAGSKFLTVVEDPKESTLDRAVAMILAIETQYGVGLSFIEEIGLRMPKKPIPDDSPLRALTAFDRPEIEARLASAREGRFRSSTGAALADDSSILF